MHKYLILHKSVYQDTKWTVSVYEITMGHVPDNLIYKETFETIVKAKRAIKKHGFTRRIEWDKIQEGHSIEIHTQC